MDGDSGGVTGLIELPAHDSDALCGTENEDRDQQEYKLERIVDLIHPDCNIALLLFSKKH